MSSIDLKLMEEVAAKIGFTVKKPASDDKFDDWRCYLVNGNKELFVSATWARNGKYYCSGVYPTDNKGNGVSVYVENGKRWEQLEKPSINFDPAKGADKIAADIKKRLLPKLEAYLAAYLEKIKQNNTYYDNMDAALIRVCNALGIATKDNREYRLYVGSYGDGNLRDVKITDSGKKVSFEVECDIEKALKMFELLKGGE